MRRSIRSKLLIYMLVSVLFYTLLLIISNSFLVERYYLKRSQRELQKTGSEIENLIASGQYDSKSETLELNGSNWEAIVNTERAKGLSVLIEGVNGNIFYPFNFNTLNAHMVTVTTVPAETSDIEVIGEAAETHAAESADEEAEANKTDASGETDNPDRTSEVNQSNTTGMSGTIDAPAENSPLIIVQRAYRIADAEPGQEDIRQEDTAQENTPETAKMEQLTLGIGSSFLNTAGNLSITQLEDGSEFRLSDDANLKVRTLSYRKPLANGLFLNVSTPLSVISEGVAISNQFSTIIGGITILFTVIWSLFISHRFTRPIKQMQAITSKMAGMDFNEKIKAGGSDELAQLAENINELSDRLDGTIKELNQRNQKLSEEVDKERKIDKMRRDFISSVSHELKTPIFLIQGYADGLRKNICSDPAKKDFYCDVINEEADKMNVIVRDLLLIARQESETTDIAIKPFEINSFIANVIDKYKIPAAKKGISMTFRPLPEITVIGDPFKLEQVLTNFINNAMDYVDADKKIEIRVEEQELQAQEVQAQKVQEQKAQQKHNIRISVYNSGTPLSKEEQMLVWNSFYKADPARNRSIGGAGLGLSIVKTIMEAHGQGYGTENAEAGVVFWFEVEVQTNESEYYGV